MKIHEYEQPIRELELLHIAIEGLVASCEHIGEMYGHEKVMDAVSVLMDEANKRLKKCDELFDLAIALSKTNQRTNDGSQRTPSPDQNPDG